MRSTGLKQSLTQCQIVDEERSRISEAVEQALQVGKGTMIVIDAEKAYTEKKELERFEDETMFSTFGACPNHPEIVFESLEPRMFSFNSPFGACPSLPWTWRNHRSLRRQSYPKQKSINNGWSI